jgi:hypothetical protein
MASEDDVRDARNRADLAEARAREVKADADRMAAQDRIDRMREQSHSSSGDRSTFAYRSQRENSLTPIADDFDENWPWPRSKFLPPRKWPFPPYPGPYPDPREEASFQALAALGRGIAEGLTAIGRQKETGSINENADPSKVDTGGSEPNSGDKTKTTPK